MGERQIEMLWRCTSCGSRNLGRFLACQACSNPKDGSERWEMPADTAAAPTVTDPALLALARGGRSWRCGYCGSDQRRADGACASCGGARPAAVSSASRPPPVPPPVPPPLPSAGGAPPAAPRRRGRKAAVVVGIVAALAGARLAGLGGPKDVQARVEAVSWKHQVAVERWQLVAHEGFAEARPRDAVQVRSLGRRVHHHEQVVDRYETEHYTEQVRDGTRTERYTESVRCGEDCTRTPERCREECTSNDNGFATCRDVCTGGDERCSPRYCSESRTREVPIYKNVARTREVPVYRSEPRYAGYFSWKAWEWAPSRVVELTGATAEPRWPTDLELAAKPPLGKGEKERFARAGTYAVTFVVGDGPKAARFQLAPATEEELRRFAVGSAHLLRVRGDELLAVIPAEAEAEQEPGAPVSPPAPTAE